MTKEQEETIKRANEIIKNGFDSEDDIELILDKLLNLIQQLQEERDKYKELYNRALSDLVKSDKKNLEKESEKSNADTEDN